MSEKKQSAVPYTRKRYCSNFDEWVTEEDDDEIAPKYAKKLNLLDGFLLFKKRQESNDSDDRDEDSVDSEDGDFYREVTQKALEEWKTLQVDEVMNLCREGATRWAFEEKEIHLKGVPVVYRVMNEEGEHFIKRRIGRKKKLTRSMKSKKSKRTKKTKKTK